MIEVYIVVPVGTVVYGGSTSLQGAVEKMPADRAVESVCVQITEDGD